MNDILNKNVEVYLDLGLYGVMFLLLLIFSPFIILGIIYKKIVLRQKRCVNCKKGLKI